MVLLAWKGWKQRKLIQWACYQVLCFYIFVYIVFRSRLNDWSGELLCMCNIWACNMMNLSSMCWSAFPLPWFLLIFGRITKYNDHYDAYLLHHCVWDLISKAWVVSVFNTVFISRPKIFLFYAIVLVEAHKRPNCSHKSVGEIIISWKLTLLVWRARLIWEILSSWYITVPKSSNSHWKPWEFSRVNHTYWCFNIHIIKPCICQYCLI